MKVAFHLGPKSLYIHSFALDSRLLWENFPGSVGGPLGWKLAQINSPAFVHQVSESATTRRAPVTAPVQTSRQRFYPWVPVDTLSPPTCFTHSQRNCGHMATTYRHICLQLGWTSDLEVKCWASWSFPTAQTIPRQGHLMSTPTEWRKGKKRNESKSTEKVR